MKVLVNAFFIAALCGLVPVQGRSDELSAEDFGFVVKKGDVAAIAGTDYNLINRGDDGVALAFNCSTGNFSVAFTKAHKLESYLVVGGGGSGGGAAGGGGGGGGVLTASPKTDLADDVTISITVGGGGVHAITPHTTPVFYNAGSNGESSSFAIGGATYSANGGGGGGSLLSPQSTQRGDGQPGANGGGASNAGTGGAGEDGGFSGGNGKSCGNNQQAMGGGGGAGEAGQSGSGDYNAGQSGRGGEGVSSSITGTAVVYGSGGGGAQRRTGSWNALAGLGGTNAGAGGYLDAGDAGGNGANGVDGTGGGGGGGAGAGHESNSYLGGSGGSGAVILLFDANNSYPVFTAVPSGYNATTAVLDVRVNAFGDTSDGASVYLAWGVKGGTLSQYRCIRRVAEIGATITKVFNNLDSATDYEASVKVVNSDNKTKIVNVDLVKGIAPTPSFDPAFEDDNLACEVSLDKLTVGGDVVYVITNAVSNKMMAKRGMEIKRILIAGGGGEGGVTMGGGGGGGACYEYDASDFSGIQGRLSIGSVSVFTVGVGGYTASPSTGWNAVGAAGGSTSLSVAGGDALVAVGGGGGASCNGAVDISSQGSGACGGGASTYKGAGVAGTGTVGFAGGASTYLQDASPWRIGTGGGGGMTTAGGAGEVNVKAGDGGEGLTSDITGVNVVYCSGGGGGGATNTPRGLGGTNGGNGANACASPIEDSYGFPGVAGTGSGGGGAGWGNGSAVSRGGAGGCGTVIFRLYPIPPPIDNCDPVPGFILVVH